MKTEYFLNELKHLGKIEERTMEKYSKIDKKGMHFLIHSYTCKGYGNLSVITMKAMFGLMKMDTVVFTPLNKEMPLLSYDNIHAMGKTTLLLELYNTCEEIPKLTSMTKVKNDYAKLPDNDLGKHWYDNLKLEPTLSKKAKGMDKKFDELTESWVHEYILLLAGAKYAEYSMKQEKTKAYVDGLFENGGPSTDQFIKMIGKEEAYELFSKYIFSSKD